MFIVLIDDKPMASSNGTPVLFNLVGSTVKNHMFAYIDSPPLKDKTGVIPAELKDQKKVRYYLCHDKESGYYFDPNPNIVVVLNSSTDSIDNAKKHLQPMKYNVGQGKVVVTPNVSAKKIQIDFVLKEESELPVVTPSLMEEIIEEEDTEPTNRLWIFIFLGFIVAIGFFFYWLVKIKDKQISEQQTSSITVPKVPLFETI